MQSEVIEWNWYIQVGFTITAVLWFISIYLDRKTSKIYKSITEKNTTLSKLLIIKEYFNLGYITRETAEKHFEEYKK